MNREIPAYPLFAPIEITLRGELHGLFKALRPDISEFAFSNLYLFRETHNYRVSRLHEGIVIAGNDGGETFFMLPFGLPDPQTVKNLFRMFSFMKCVPESYVEQLRRIGCDISEDRDNFDYVYEREALAGLSGRRFHRKKNLVNFFTGTYNYEARPLLAEYVKDALLINDKWREVQEKPGDYEAAKEALERCDELALCGAIYFVEGKPAAFTLGEELNPETFVIHFEKGISDYKGLLQFVTQSFSALLPDKYRFINREQDLGDEGLRKAKTSYRPAAFVKKYRAFLKG